MPETTEERDERLIEAIKNLYAARVALTLMDFRPLLTQHPATDWDSILRLRDRALASALTIYQTVGRWIEGENVAVPPVYAQPWHESMTLGLWLVVATGNLREAQTLTHVNDGPFGDYAPLLDAIDAAEELERRVKSLLYDDPPEANFAPAPGSGTV